MQKISETTLTGERALFQVKDVEIENCIFEDGESPLKHSDSIEVSGTSFRYKYPLWYSNNVKVKDSVFFELGKSGIWYANDLEFKNVQIDAPKEFRRCKNISLEDVIFTNAAETFWTCDGVTLKNVQAKGDYFAMNSMNMKCENFNLSGNYFFDGGKNIEVRNSRLISKDAFWNCENVTVYDSVIIGEYLGWNSKNLRFVNCTIESNQGFCYIDGLKLENCTLLNTDLAFEYCSNIDADTHGKIRSVKNPISGRIKADEIVELLLDETKIDPSKTEIICDKIGKISREITDKNILQ
ncbi:MAG: DUF3737 family protein [Treponema sp.]|nr:DUF3737 family protein [Treponema sp.]